MTMGREEFEQYCRPAWRDLVVEAWQTAVAESRNPSFYAAKARRILNPSTLAHIRSDHANFHAERLIADAPGIGIVPRQAGQRSFYLLGSRVVMILKKLDEDLRSRNIPTGQARAFLNQLPIPELELVEKATNIIAGYTVDEMDTGLRILFTCPHGERNLWAWEIWAEEDGSAILDLAPSAPPTERRQRLVQPKEADRKRREADGASE